MNAVLHDITDHNQSNVVSFDDRRELDVIKGKLASLCFELLVTPATLLMAAQQVQNHLRSGLSEPDAFIEGVKYAKRNQEPSPALVKAYDELQELLHARRSRPLSVEGELAAVDAAFGGDGEAA